MELTPRQHIKSLLPEKPGSQNDYFVSWIPRGERTLEEKTFKNGPAGKIACEKHGSLHPHNPGVMG